MARQPKVILSDEDIQELREKHAKGESLRALATEFNISRTYISTILGIKTGKKPLNDEAIERSKRKACRAKSQERKAQFEAVEVETYQKVIQGEYIDVFEGIRQSVKDMLELNEEQRKAIPEMTENLKQLLVYYEEGTLDLEDKGSVSIFNQIRKTLEQIDSFYFRGKLRIDSRKELGNWFDRYKDLEMQVKYLNYYENVISAFLAGLNNQDERIYNQIREDAIKFFPATERYFLQNETIPEQQSEQQQPAEPEQRQLQAPEHNNK